MTRLNVPFTVLVVCEVSGLRKGDLGSVTAIKMDLKLLDIYIVIGKPYLYYNFVFYFY